MSDNFKSLPTQELAMPTEQAQKHKHRYVKYGWKVTKEGRKQRYQCQECGDIKYE